MSAAARAVTRWLGRLNLREVLEGAAVSAGFFAGLAMIGFGVAMVSVPAGLIVGGAMLATVAGLYARSAA